MTADRLPPGVAALLAEIEAGRLSDGARLTLARALRAAVIAPPVDVKAMLA